MGMRIGIINDWKSKWFTSSAYADYLREDMEIRNYLEQNLSNAAISKIEVERASDKLKIDIFSARPGIVIGKKGSSINEIRKYIEDMTHKVAQINIQEVKTPELDARLVAQSIAQQLESRVSYRKAMKKAVSAAMRAGAKGIKVSCGGRLAGAEMARTEWYREGRVPLHTLRANIDYGFYLARTTFGCIGVKVWIYLGDVLVSSEEAAQRAAAERAKDRERAHMDHEEEPAIKPERN